MKALRATLTVMGIWMCLQTTCFSLMPPPTEINATTIDSIPIRLTATTEAASDPRILIYTISIELKSASLANVKPVVDLSIQEGGRFIVKAPVAVYTNGSKWEFNFFVSKDLLDETRVDIVFPDKVTPGGYECWFKLSSHFTK
jgi:hypothetical protein